ncbi:hypothetical protein, partial [uncultured Ruminococcus sp.]|uniref:hypothetical protein n=1 Tax=uncultured Ruminococcus sp. TaxID=165186 RepID=UPI0025E534E3
RVDRLLTKVVCLPLAYGGNSVFLWGGLLFLWKCAIFRHFSKPMPTYTAKCRQFAGIQQRSRIKCDF